jgi:hypothetical protein
MTMTEPEIRGRVGVSTESLTAAGETGLPTTSLGELPAPVLPRYCLVTTADIVPDSDIHWESGKTLRAYPNPNIQPWTIETGGASKPDPATFRQVTTKSFWVVGVWQCDSGGIITPEEFSQRAAESFLAWETVAVEKQFWANGLNLDPFLAIAKAADHATYSAGDSVNVLNSGTATQPIAALAELEDYIGEFPLPGVIHARPGFGSMLGFPYLQPAGQKLETIMGTKLVVGSGYPGTGVNGASASALQEWVFATGPVEIRRSEVVPFDRAPIVVDRDQNNWTIYYERNYLVTFDPLIHAAILIDRSKGLG